MTVVLRRELSGYHLLNTSANVYYKYKEVSSFKNR